MPIKAMFPPAKIAPTTPKTIMPKPHRDALIETLVIK